MNMLIGEQGERFRVIYKHYTLICVSFLGLQAGAFTDVVDFASSRSQACVMLRYTQAVLCICLTFSIRNSGLCIWLQSTKKMLTAPTPSQAGKPFHAFILKSIFGSKIRNRISPQKLKS